jgi:hypothetical protein
MTDDVELEQRDAIPVPLNVTPPQGIVTPMLRRQPNSVLRSPMLLRGPVRPSGLLLLSCQASGAQPQEFGTRGFALVAWRWCDIFMARKSLPWRMAALARSGWTDRLVVARKVL